MELQSQLIARANLDARFANGLGYGMGHNLVTLHEVNEDLIDRVTRNADFQAGLGAGIGWNFANLSRKNQNGFFARARKDTSNALFFGLPNSVLSNGKSWC